MKEDVSRGPLQVSRSTGGGTAVACRWEGPSKVTLTSTKANVLHHIHIRMLSSHAHHRILNITMWYFNRTGRSTAKTLLGVSTLPQ